MPEETEIGRTVAALVRTRLVESGHPVEFDDLLPAGPLHDRNLVELGLDSLSWLRLAAEIESAVGYPLDDELLLDDSRRSVAGWTAYLHEHASHGGNVSVG